MSLSNLFTDEMRRNPFPIFEQLRSSTPVLKFSLADLWMVFDYDSVKRALTDHEAFSSRASPPGGKPLDWMIFTDPPRHTKLRALISRAFTPRAIAGLEPRIRELSCELLDQAIERGQMDLCADYSIPLPIMVIAELIGIPIEERARFRGWTDDILLLAETVGGGEEAERAAAAFSRSKAEMREYLSGMLAARRTSPKDDLLTRLIEAEVDGERLDEDEILGFFLLLLLAGSETTTNLISSAVLCFLEHPGELARVLATPALLPTAIEEVLRYRSPVQAVFRATRRDIELRGQTIPAGKLVLLMLGAANRDPAHFADPGRFDVGRDPNPHLAFGHGLHFCLGAPLSRLEGRIALTDLLARVRDIELVSPEPWQPRKAFLVHGPASLPIRFTPGPRPAP